ncbi:MAG: bifunctional hydroxymethylpyrimidine kinase/phosphomethylpyrimidine kinase [Candidatus Methanogaster sp.]|uniref:Bifunctional hydroxymethylpyrimidine kinase/phosphomethylpyrimidine kinase n=1 Tax=Candidatus Methanogaster sp. TaxID=3386292 RepID=A0AC61L3R8_9EURY|nr:MAG: bifunctional hydroxymethylpyrimidine kinase/phosphomethylpyrimidine kinase [ANME-2 cluster archaeon]
MQCILTIAGSDSGGGAGIEADLKTFAALGIHGACAITSVTAQNTLGVERVYDLPKDVIVDQIRAVTSDIRVDYVKIGMLSSERIVRTVAREVEGIPFVLDPVMAAEAGGSLLAEDALDALVSVLIPLASAVTPNVYETSAITGIRIRSIEDAMRAAAAIATLGCRAAVITGGHLDGADVLCESSDGMIESPRLIRGAGGLIAGGTHGAGCTYSAALAAYLAKGLSVSDACTAAKVFVEEAIANSSGIGRGVAPVNQTRGVTRDAARYRAIADVSAAVKAIEGSRSFASLIPEVGCNIGSAIPEAQSVGDVAAVRGRIAKIGGGRARAVGCAEFGASSHIARLILAVMQFDPMIRSAMNIRYSEGVISACEECGYTMASFDRKDEPPHHKTMDWGAEYAITEAGSVPQVIWDAGGVGKEAMVRILGRSAVEVAGLAIRVVDL